ncbi:uncharacterized, partial [Tachysurus ichikawai]
MSVPISKKSHQAEDTGSRDGKDVRDEDQAAVMSGADLRWSRAVIGSQKAVHYREATDRSIGDGKKEGEKLCSARRLYQDVTSP